MKVGPSHGNSLYYLYGQYTQPLENKTSVFSMIKSSGNVALVRPLFSILDNFATQ